jgi:exonuclease III
MSQNFQDKYGIVLKDSIIHDKIQGSDHCPIELHIDLTGASSSAPKTVKQK